MYQVNMGVNAVGASYTQSGGNVTISNLLYLGYSYPSSMTVSAGHLSLAQVNEAQGSGAAGSSLAQSGGNVTVSGTWYMGVGGASLSDYQWRQFYFHRNPVRWLHSGRNDHSERWHVEDLVPVNNTASGTVNFNGKAPCQLGTSFNPSASVSTVVQSGGAVIDTNTFSTTIATNLSNGTGGGGLTKMNSGTLTLSASNGYTGTTFVSGGTLALSGSFPNNIPNSSAITVGSGAKLDVTGLTSTSGAISLASGQVLGGAGTVTGATVVASGSKISAGTSIALGTGGTPTRSARSPPAPNFSQRRNILRKARQQQRLRSDQHHFHHHDGLTLTATSGSKFNVTEGGTAGSLNPATAETWTIATFTGTTSGTPSGYSGTLPASVAGSTVPADSQFVLDTSTLATLFSGSEDATPVLNLEYVSSTEDALQISYAAPPSPGTARSYRRPGPLLMGRRRRNSAAVYGERVALVRPPDCKGGWSDCGAGKRADAGAHAHPTASGPRPGVPAESIARSAVAATGERP